MKRLTYISILGSVALLTAGCVHFVALPLNTAQDNDPFFKVAEKQKAEYIDKFTATDIFTETLKNTWGTEKDDCRDFEVVNNVNKDGSACLAITWDKSKKGCGWIGSGWAWNNWQPMDMSNIVNTWGLQFMIRTKEGKMGTIPIGLALLDNSDKSTDPIGVSNRFYKGFGINEEWKTVTIPLKAFRIAEKGLNPAEIKQMIMTLDGSGSIYIDEFKVVNMDTTAKK